MRPRRPKQYCLQSDIALWLKKSKTSLHLVHHLLIDFHTFCVILTKPEEPPKCIFLYISKWKFQQVRHTFWVRFRRVFNIFCWNLKRTLPDNQAQKRCQDFFMFCFFQMLWLFWWRECMFYQLSETNQTSNQISWHCFIEKCVKKHRYINHVFPLRSDRKRAWLVNVCSLKTSALYLENLKHFF